jgi:hypothetical protein
MTDAELKTEKQPHAEMQRRKENEQLVFLRLRVSA